MGLEVLPHSWNDEALVLLRFEVQPVRYSMIASKSLLHFLQCASMACLTSVRDRLVMKLRKWSTRMPGFYLHFSIRIQAWFGSFLRGFKLLCKSKPLVDTILLHMCWIIFFSWVISASLAILPWWMLWGFLQAMEVRVEIRLIYKDISISPLNDNLYSPEVYSIISSWLPWISWGEGLTILHSAVNQVGQANIGHR